MLASGEMEGSVMDGVLVVDNADDDDNGGGGGGGDFFIKHPEICAPPSMQL